MHQGELETLICMILWTKSLTMNPLFATLSRDSLESKSGP